eukprot:COSAG02_NODE_2236_length_9419_cov_5.189807_3_plen_71_part_00
MVQPAVKLLLSVAKLIYGGKCRDFDVIMKAAELATPQLKQHGIMMSIGKRNRYWKKAKVLIRELAKRDRR